MIEAIRDLIEESRKRAKSQYTPSGDRTKWTRLAGQLIWYKDQILRSLTMEALEIEVLNLKKKVYGEGNEPPREVRFPRRTIIEPPVRRRRVKNRKPTLPILRQTHRRSPTKR